MVEFVVGAIAFGIIGSFVVWVLGVVLLAICVKFDL